MNCVRILKLFLAVLYAAWLSSCSTTAHYPINPADPGREQKKEYRFANLDPGQSSNRLGMMLTFSGGGTRAAALAHGVLEELADTRVNWDGKQRILIDEVDIISAVSGGSIVAAHYALHGKQHFNSFPDNFLHRDMQSSIQDRILSLEILPLLGSSYFGRIEIVAEKMDKHLFQGASYDDLVKHGRKPYIILNATDMSSGARFPFTQDQFDLICADLNAIPLARAVSASAAVPVIFSPLTLRNYADRCAKPIHGAVGRERNDLSSRESQRLSELRSYRDSRRRPYLHLVDGGLADNIGVWSGIDSTLLSGGISGLIHDMGLEHIEKAVFIVVSAETDPTLEADLTPDVPNVRRVAQAFADIPINHHSRESLILFRETLRKWQHELGMSLGRQVDFYLIEVRLRDIKNEKERNRFMQIPTSLHLPREDVDDLRQLGRRMLRNSPEFRRFLRDMQ